MTNLRTLALRADDARIALDASLEPAKGATAEEQARARRAAQVAALRLCLGADELLAAVGGEPGPEEPGVPEKVVGYAEPTHEQEFLDGAKWQKENW